jgi:purine-binding chemotaxis protein CheW
MPTLTRETPGLQRSVCAQIDQLVVFQLAGERYAFPLDDVQEIQQIVALAEVPAGTDGVVGMVNLRGQVIPAVDLSDRLGVDPVSRGLNTPMLVARYRDLLVALIVDAVDDVLGLPDGCLQPAPTLHPLFPVMHGVARLGEELVCVLDVARLLDSKASLS